jgi:hypothetical protein
MYSPVIFPACQRQADEVLCDTNRQWQRRLAELEEEAQDRMRQADSAWGEWRLRLKRLALQPVALSRQAAAEGFLRRAPTTQAPPMHVPVHSWSAPTFCAHAVIRRDSIQYCDTT